MHYCGILINTPNYDKSFADVLDMYDENEHCSLHREVINDFEKINFICYYTDGIDIVNIVKEYIGKNNISLKENETPYWYVYSHRDDFVSYFKKNYKEYFDNFPLLFDEYKDKWTDGWQRDYITNEYVEVALYNDKSAYDWYSIGGRWNEFLKNKNENTPDTEYLGELDLTDKNYFSKDNMPYFFIVDGLLTSYDRVGMNKFKEDHDEWAERMWDMLQRLPEDSEVCVVDFHN